MKHLVRVLVVGEPTESLRALAEHNIAVYFISEVPETWDGPTPDVAIIDTGCGYFSGACLEAVNKACGVWPVTPLIARSHASPQLVGDLISRGRLDSVLDPQTPLEDSARAVWSAYGRRQSRAPKVLMERLLNTLDLDPVSG